MKLADFIAYVKNEDFFLNERAIRAIEDGYEGDGLYIFATEYHDYSFELSSYDTLDEARESHTDEDFDENYWNDFKNENDPEDLLWGEGWCYVYLSGKN